jgi:hypothetical protein
LSGSAELVEIVVTVREDYAQRLDDVAAGLRAAGMRVDDILGGIGMISGAATAASFPSLKALPGVLDVEVSKPYGLG